MSRIKVLDINTINEMLDKGNFLRYDCINAKVHILNNNSDILGAVRFNTYINLIREHKLRRVRSASIIYDLYERRR